jgi:hypothetical protein
MSLALINATHAARLAANPSDPRDSAPLSFQVNDSAAARADREFWRRWHAGEPIVTASGKELRKGVE